MSTLEERRSRRLRGCRGDEAWEDGFARPLVFLQPIAAPSILGLAGFAGATFIVASNLAGWWGTPASGLTLAPFAAMFGGVGAVPGRHVGLQGTRRDRHARTRHLGRLLARLRHPQHPARDARTDSDTWYHNPEVGFWFFALAITTAIAALAATTESLASRRRPLDPGGRLRHPRRRLHIYGSHGWTQVAGWVLVFSAGFAWYTVMAMLMAATTGRTIFPLFKHERATTTPRGTLVRPIELEWAKPRCKDGPVKRGR